MQRILQIFAIFVLAVSFFITLSPSASADTNLDPCQGAKAEVDNGKAIYNPCLINDADQSGSIIRNAIVAILVVSAVVALVFLIWGGFKWITSGGDKAKVEAARNTIIAAVVGLIVAFLAYFILTIVLSLFKIKLEDLKLPNLMITGEHAERSAPIN